MSTYQQLDAFNQFARSIIAAQGEDLSFNEVQDRWQQKQRRTQYIAAIQEAVDSYETDDREWPIEAFLAVRDVARSMVEL